MKISTKSGNSMEVNFVAIPFVFVWSCIWVVLMAVVVIGALAVSLPCVAWNCTVAFFRGYHGNQRD